jgi:hypothetical protein
MVLEEALFLVYLFWTRHYGSIVITYKWKVLLPVESQLVLELILCKFTQPRKLESKFLALLKEKFLVRLVLILTLCHDFSSISAQFVHIRAVPILTRGLPEEKLAVFRPTKRGTDQPAISYKLIYRENRDCCFMRLTKGNVGGMADSLIRLVRFFGDCQIQNFSIL